MAAVPALDELAGTREFGARELLSYLWPASGATRSKLRVVGALALLLAAKLFIVRVPFIFKRCIDSLSSPAASPLAPVGWMLVYSFSRAIYTLLQEGRYLMFTPVGQSALRRFIRDAFEHVQQLDAGWLGSQSTGELSRIFARGVRGMNTLLRLLVFNVLPTTLEAALVVTLLGRRYGTAVALASLLCVLVFTSWSILMVGRRVALLSEMNDIDNAIFTRFFNSLLNNEAVRSFTNERHEVIQYERLLQRVEGLSIRDVQTVSLLNAGQALVFSTGLAAVMACCARRVMCGAMGLGDAVAIHGMLLQLHGPLTSLGFTYQDIRGALTDMRQLVTLLRRTPAITSPPDAPELTVSHGAIRFEDVSFAYGGKTSGALRNVTFAIEPGQKTAIVGPSGSGKSTVLKLITRSYDVGGGSVLIDGQDVRQVEMSSLRRQIGLVPQETTLFDDTMLYNLQYGNLNASSSAALIMASRVGLDATAAKMSSGYDTRVGERGLTLSGGERQRVAIARALLKDPPLMLYDEPTSALDALTEESITALMKNSEANRTSVVVAHKLRTIADAHRIIVMANGTVAECGTHEELLAIEGSTYSRMWTQQASQQSRREAARASDALLDALFDHSLLDDEPRSPDLLSIAELRQPKRVEVDEALALQAIDGGWLW